MNGKEGNTWHTAPLEWQGATQGSQKLVELLQVRRFGPAMVFMFFTVDFF